MENLLFESVFDYVYENGFIGVLYKEFFLYRDKRLLGNDLFFLNLLYI